jgi:thioredoxin 1
MKSIRKSEELQLFLKQHPLAIVNFSAPWCSPCLSIDPLYEELVSQNPKIGFAKVNTEEDGGISDTYSVNSMPTFLAFRDGNLVDKFTGSKTTGLLNLVNELNKTNC